MSFKGPLRKRTIEFSGKAGFPSGIYFDMVDVLQFYDYEVHKVEDWLEVNPHSDFYQDIAQKKQNIEQQVGRILKNISDMRKDLEMLRHDKRKLDRIIEHKEEGDLDVLKSDFVDLVDRETEMNLLDLANSGRLPSIVVDFYKVESEEDIEDLNVSKGEKQILKKKWTAFQDWMKRYVDGIRQREEMIDKEIESKKATIESYKDSLQPYAKALKRIKIGEPDEYKGMSDPMIIERYPSSVVGVKLYAWKPISAEAMSREVHEIPADVEKIDEEEGLDFYSFLEINVSKKSLVSAGKEVEGVSIEIDPQLKHREEVKEKKEEIKEKEKKLLQEIKNLGGEATEEEEEEEEESLTGKLKSFGRKALRIPKETEAHPKYESELKEVIEYEVDDIYEKIKDLGDGLKLKRHRSLKK